mmetsp:Transcript_26847/g.75356  ORF Transcript_26847/g.75356 Transcript_26847/m.75356 type:complete len:587 (-) Transcript_26847:199-1959(-)
MLAFIRDALGTVQAVMLVLAANFNLVPARHTSEALRAYAVLEVIFVMRLVQMLDMLDRIVQVAQILRTCLALSIIEAVNVALSRIFFAVAVVPVVWTDVVFGVSFVVVNGCLATQSSVPSRASATDVVLATVSTIHAKFCLSEVVVVDILRAQHRRLVLTVLAVVQHAGHGIEGSRAVAFVDGLSSDLGRNAGSAKVAMVLVTALDELVDLSWRRVGDSVIGADLDLALVSGPTRVAGAAVDALVLAFSAVGAEMTVVAKLRGGVLARVARVEDARILICGSAVAVWLSCAGGAADATVLTLGFTARDWIWVLADVVVVFNLVCLEFAVLSTPVGSAIAVPLHVLIASAFVGAEMDTLESQQSVGIVTNDRGRVLAGVSSVVDGIGERVTAFAEFGVIVLHASSSIEAVSVTASFSIVIVGIIVLGWVIGDFDFTHPAGESAVALALAATCGRTGSAVDAERDERIGTVVRRNEFAFLSCVVDVLLRTVGSCTVADGIFEGACGARRSVQARQVGTAWFRLVFTRVQRLIDIDDAVSIDFELAMQTLEGRVALATGIRVVLVAFAVVGAVADAVQGSGDWVWVGAE